MEISCSHCKKNTATSFLNVHNSTGVIFFTIGFCDDCDAQLSQFDRHVLVHKLIAERPVPPSLITPTLIKVDMADPTCSHCHKKTGAHTYLYEDHRPHTRIYFPHKMVIAVTLCDDCDKLFDGQTRINVISEIEAKRLTAAP